MNGPQPRKFRKLLWLLVLCIMRPMSFHLKRMDRYNVGDENGHPPHRKLAQDPKIALEESRCLLALLAFMVPLASAAMHPVQMSRPLLLEAV